jgi:chloramphenicol O-acetyltransferase type B
MLSGVIRQIVSRNRIRVNLREKLLPKNFPKDTSVGEFTYGLNPSERFLKYEDQANFRIGKFCSIADGLSIFLGGGHRLDLLSTFPFGHVSTFKSSFIIPDHPTTNGNVTIGNDVWIGSNVTIMSGISISSGAVIAANSHVTKNIGPYEVWGGNPAKMLKYRVSPILIPRLLDLGWWNWCSLRINHFGNLFCEPITTSLVALLEDAKLETDVCDDGCNI